MKLWLCAFATGALLSVAGVVQAPWHWAALVALAPWLSALSAAKVRAALLSAVLVAVLFTAGAFFPVAGALATYSGAPLWIGWAVTLLLGPLVLQPQLVAVALVRELPFGTAALTYVGAEWALPKLFHDTLGYALYPSLQLRQLAEFGGGRALTLLCVFVSECVAARRYRTAAAVVAAALALGALRVPTEAAKSFFAGVVQANITAYDKLAAEQGTFETVRQILDTHQSLSNQLLQQGPLDLLVWPETVYPTTFGAPKSEEGAAFDAQIASIAKRVPLVFGAFETSGQGEHNAAFFLEGPAVQSYRKTLLFPLTEHVPAWLEPLRRPWMGHWQPGPGARVLTVHGLRLAPLICYEALDASYVASAARQGAQVLLTLSNDAWWPGARGPRLHLILAAFRSIETRLPQIRATNSGISALILPGGELRDVTSFDERAAVRMQVPLVEPRWTLSKAFGDWLGPSSLVAAFLLIARRRLRRDGLRPQA